MTVRLGASRMSSVFGLKVRPSTAMASVTICVAVLTESPSARSSAAPAETMVTAEEPSGRMACTAPAARWG